MAWTCVLNENSDDTAASITKERSDGGFLARTAKARLLRAGKSDVKKEDARTLIIQRARSVIAIKICVK